VIVATFKSPLRDPVIKGPLKRLERLERSFDHEERAAYVATQVGIGVLLLPVQLPMKPKLTEALGPIAPL
jgi:hypothetical protein